MRRISPQEGAHDVRPFAECTWTYIQRTPEHPRAPGGQATAWMPEVEQRRSSCRSPEGTPPGVCFFGYLSLHKLKKVTRSPAGRVEALLLDEKETECKELDSGLRRNDEVRRESGGPADAGQRPGA